MKPDLLTFDEALALLLQHAPAPVASESVDTMDALGRVLAQDVKAGLDVPAVDNAQMDGYAVRRADLREGRPLRIAQRIPAGAVGSELEPGTAARIFTGAPTPPGADAVVMQEQAEVDGDQVIIRHQPSDGEWIRRRGEDIRDGGVILRAGDRLGAAALGLAASIGLPHLPVWRRLRVATFYTGNELAMPGEPLAPGAIYNSNRFVLSNVIRALGCELTDLGIVPDSLSATREALREAAATHDLIVTSGGMSVGEEDHVRPALQAEGELKMWSLAIKPGKPLAHGLVRRGGDRGAEPPAQFIGLPGNPVSALVTFLLLGRPFLLRMQGASTVTPPRLPLRADFAWSRPDRRREFLRVRINAQGGLDLFPNQGSAVLTSTVWADGLVDNPENHPIAPGDVVSFIPFASLLQ